MTTRGLDGRHLREAIALRVLRLVALLCAAIFLLAFAYVTISRISYPFALEWMEGTSIVQVDRLLHGQALYVEPSLEYIPLIYPPLYYAVSALLSAWMGPGFFPLRLVSLGSTLGTMVCIYVLVGRAYRDAFAQLTAVGLFSATFKAGEAWFDIARVDMLALFLTLAAIVALERPKALGLAASGVLMSLACLTKQSFVPFLLAGAGMAMVLHSWRGWPFLASAVAACVSSFVVLDRVYLHWYRYFVYELPYGHQAGLNIEGALNILGERILLPVAFSCALALMFFIVSMRQRAWKGALSFLLLVGTALGIGWLGLMNPGGFNNVLVPWHALLSSTVGMSLGAIARLGNVRLGFRVAVLLLLILQFAALAYDPGKQIPSANDRLAGEALVREIRATPGEVFVPYHPELALLAGRRTYADWVGLKELKGGFGGEGGAAEWQRVKTQLLTSLRHRRFALILVDGPNFLGQPENHYVGEPIEYVADDTFFPVTGWRIRPSIKFVPPRP